MQGPFTVWYFETRHFGACVEAVRDVGGYTVRAYVREVDGPRLAEDSFDCADVYGFGPQARTMLRAVIAEARAAMTERQARIAAIRVRREAEPCPA